MSLSQPITSLNAAKHILNYLCVLPTDGIKRSQVIYHISLLVVFEVLFWTVCYIKYIYNEEVYIHIQEYDVFYFVEEITWFAIGHSFAFAVAVSLLSRSAQQELIRRMAMLDARLKLQLNVNLSFRRLNIEFIIYSSGTTLYFLVYFLIDSICCEHDSISLIYDLCVIVATDFFYIYAWYCVYWARVFNNRSNYIIDVLRTTVSLKHISKRSLTAVMELIKLLFDARESIQNAFGAMLFMVIIANTFLIAEGMFGVIHNVGRHQENVYFWLDYLWWSLMLLAEFVYIIVCFSKIGVVASTRNFT